MVSRELNLYDIRFNLNKLTFFGGFDVVLSSKLVSLTGSGRSTMSPTTCKAAKTKHELNFLQKKTKVIFQKIPD